jgi:putative transposase
MDTFYYLISILDGYSRFIVHWEIRERSTERDVELVLQRAREKFPGTTPRIISDNGPQFVSREFNPHLAARLLSARPFCPRPTSEPPLPP